MTTIKLGKNAKLYANTGTYAAPTWTEVTSVVDASVNESTEKADVTRRGSGGRREEKPTFVATTLELSLIKDDDDTGLDEIIAQIKAQDYVELAACDDADGANTNWFNALFSAESFAALQNLADGQQYEATLFTQPANATDNVSPAWGSGALPTTRP